MANHTRRNKQDRQKLIGTAVVVARGRGEGEEGVKGVTRVMTEDWSLVVNT